MKVTVDQNAKAAFISPDNETVAGAAEEMLVEAAPLVNAQFLAKSTSKCKEPGFARAHKGLR